jgi:CheY-like chemotaxis protein
MVARTLRVPTNMTISTWMRQAGAAGGDFGFGGLSAAVVAEGGGSGGGSVGPRESILVIEDDAATRETLSLALEDNGYSVTGVANGQEALQHLRRTAPPNLILLDLRMPVMNGWEFRKRQAQDPALKSIPVVVISAYADDPQNADALGAKEYLVKPFDFDKLLQAIQRYC